MTNNVQPHGIISFLWLLVILAACNNKTEERSLSDSKVNNSQAIVDTKALARRANSFYEQNNYPQAISSYDSLILIDSTKAGYYFKRGYCKSMLLNNSKGAIADYKKAIERNYSGKDAAYLNIGGLYKVVLNNQDSAAYYYKEYLKMKPDKENVDIENLEKKTAMQL